MPQDDDADSAAAKHIRVPHGAGTAFRPRFLWTILSPRQKQALLLGVILAVVFLGLYAAQHYYIANTIIQKVDTELRDILDDNKRELASDGKRQYLPPAGKTSRYMPSPSLRRMRFFSAGHVA